MVHIQPPPSTKFTPHACFHSFPPIHFPHRCYLSSDDDAEDDLEEGKTLPWVLSPPEDGDGGFGEDDEETLHAGYGKKPKSKRMSKKRPLALSAPSRRSSTGSSNNSSNSGRDDPFSMGPSTEKEEGAESDDNSEVSGSAGGFSDTDSVRSSKS